MHTSPFHVYYTARTLADLSEDESLAVAFASSDINIYPYQIAAARFALRSPYLKGVILCDEGSLGKTYEALLIATQKWHEGKTRQLLILPTNLIKQWIGKIENGFSLPFVLLDNEDVFNNVKIENPFEQPTLVITSYDFAVDKSEYIKKQTWDLIIFDEASCLAKAYTGQNKTANILKEAAGNAFKLLLTPTPITMSIMDIYGLIYFIDESVLPNENDFYTRYFRKPENYPELTDWVSKYCFRTLKSQVTDYVNFTNRISYTIGYELTPKEKELYVLLDNYLSMPEKISYPKMNRYDLTLMLYHILSSSTQAFVRTLNGTIDRLGSTMVDESKRNILLNEYKLLNTMKELAETIDINGKSKILLSVLKKCFTRFRSLKITQKAVIFTDNRITQNYLQKLLAEKHNVLTYSGANSRDYDIMEQFRNDKNIQILIATDEAAKGLDIEFCPVVINYDMLYNAVELEQRNSRCHRQGQQSDVIVINLLGKENFSDVRILELVNKRVLQFDGIFGMSEDLLGSFDENVDEMLSFVRTRGEVFKSFEDNLKEHESKNKQLVSHTEDTIFTTFSKDIADKITVTPQYIQDKAKQINKYLWEVVSSYFSQYNEQESSGYFEIDEQLKTITAEGFNDLPKLFYYFTGSQNKPYKSLKKYGLNKDFKPHHGKITLVSPLVKGILENIACADNGTVTIDAEIEPCTIGFYCVKIRTKSNMFTSSETVAEANIFAGKTQSGELLSDEECKRIMELPVLSFSDDGKKTEYWLRNSTGNNSRHELDSLATSEEIIKKYADKRNSAQAEEIEKMKLVASRAKAELEHTLDDIKAQITEARQEAERAVERLKKMTADKKIKVLQQDYKKKEESLFFDGLRLDTELEQKINEFVDNERLSGEAKRQYVVRVEGK